MTTSTTTATGATRVPVTRTRSRGWKERAKSLVLGRTDQARWERPALIALLVATGLFYLVNLSASSYGNEFYAAAAQAGSKNFEAFLFGSSDAANSITVDKPPMSLWFMAISVRIFGLSPFAIMFPELLMGVATVGVVYATVRRYFNAPAALLAGGVLAITPVAALMFRFNNPDALLVLWLSIALYATVRALEKASWKWMVMAGLALGFGFLTKQLQAFLPLPVLGLVFLFFANGKIGRRILGSLAGIAGIVLGAGWWVAIVELVPTSWRPYIGGSQNNDFLELTLGYNGLGRLSGDETGSVTPGRGGNGGGGMWGETGITRMFSSEFGGQISWLIPAAIILFVAAIILLWKRPRTDLQRAVVITSFGTMLITGLAFSFMQGIIHPYYAVALAPFLAASIGASGFVVWRHRESMWVRIMLGVASLATTVWSFAILSWTPDWMPWLRWVVLVIGMAAAVLAVIPSKRKVLVRTSLAVILTAGLLGPAAYSVQTVLSSHQGSIVSAGPASAMGGMGRMGGGGAPGGQGGPGGGTGGTGGQGAPGGTGTTGQGGAGGQGGQGGQMPGGQGAPGGTNSSSNSQSSNSQTSQQGGPGAAGGEMGGRGGGMLGGRASLAVVKLLEKNSNDYTWVAATIGSQSAASYQLATDSSVMPIGGFNGSDPSPTLAQFKKYVAEKKIHYFIGGGGMGQQNGGSSASSEISAWVKANFTAKTVDGVTVYDLTQSK